MLFYLTIILCCQLAGELLVAATGLPVPGPVCGMLLLFAGLLINRGVPEELSGVANAFLTNLSLLFVPAGVGVMLHFQLLGREWLPVLAALFVSTALTVGVTASLMAYLNSRKPDGGAGQNPGGGE